MESKANVKSRKTTTRPDEAKQADNQAAQAQIEAALANFQVIRNKRLLRVFDVLPAAVMIATIFFLFAIWYARGTIQLSFATAGPTVILVLLVIRVLFARFPRSLLIIWHRKLLQPKSGAEPASPATARQGIADEFMEFIHRSEDQLNSRLGVACGLAVTILVLWLFWPFNGLTPAGWLVSFVNDWFSTTITACLFLIYYGAAFMGGLILWRVIVIARRVSQLGSRFDFNLQVEHPDGCGGFRPIGDLCLTLAYVLAPLLFAVGGWLVALNLVTPDFMVRYLYITPANLPFAVSQLQVLATFLVALSLLGFLQPLAAIHEAMTASKTRLQDDLDRISEEIHETSSTLRVNAEKLSAEQGVSLEQKIDFLHRVYNRNGRIPTWPVNYEHLWRLLSIQVAPAIGIATSGLGLANTISGLIK